MTMACDKFLSTMKLCVQVVLIVISLGSLSESLLCYQCAATHISEPCVQDLGGMMNTSLGISKKYYKNCTDSKSTWKYCVIEEYQSNGQTTAYRRECHDGETFGFSGSEVFQGLKKNNATTCAQINSLGKLICLSFCDTDFCNGPEKPEQPVVEIDPCSLVNSTHNASFFGCGALGIHATDGPMATVKYWGLLLASLVFVLALNL